MKTRDLFGLAVRLLGLLFFYKGLEALPMTIRHSLDALLRLPASFNDGSIIAWPFMGLWPFAVAVWFLYGAPPLMRIAYPSGSRKPGEADQE